MKYIFGTNLKIIFNIWLLLSLVMLYVLYYFLVYMNSIYIWIYLEEKLWYFYDWWERFFLIVFLIFNMLWILWLYKLYIRNKI
jgi:hypothetical protein